MAGFTLSEMAGTMVTVDAEVRVGSAFEAAVMLTDAGLGTAVGAV